MAVCQVRVKPTALLAVILLKSVVVAGQVMLAEVILNIGAGAGVGPVIVSATTLETQVACVAVMFV